MRESIVLVANDPVVRATATMEIPDLGALAALGSVTIVTPRPARRPRRSTLPTWDELVEREPRLGALLEEIRAMPRNDPQFCGVRAWFGPKYRGDGIKARMVQLVGWHAERDDPVLRTDIAYRVVYRSLYDALPPCEDRACGAVARALYGAERLP